MGDRSSPFIRFAHAPTNSGYIPKLFYYPKLVHKIRKR